jgi:putative PIN family toxin of toxin-antitoxin system
VRRVVIDTNVFVSALLSRRGASYGLLTFLDKGVFQFSLSVPLVVEYEDAAKRVLPQTILTEEDLDSILDYICQIGDKHQIYYLWRPFLRDPRDDMILELAVAAECDTIITFNIKDFAGVEAFGLEVLTPTNFLRQIG